MSTRSSSPASSSSSSSSSDSENPQEHLPTPPPTPFLEAQSATPTPAIVSVETLNSDQKELLEEEIQLIQLRIEREKMEIAALEAEMGEYLEQSPPEKEEEGGKDLRQDPRKERSILRIPPSIPVPNMRMRRRRREEVESEGEDDEEQQLPFPMKDRIFWSSETTVNVDPPRLDSTLLSSFSRVRRSTSGCESSPAESETRRRAIRLPPARPMAQLQKEGLLSAATWKEMKRELCMAEFERLKSQWSPYLGKMEEGEGEKVPKPEEILEERTESDGGRCEDDFDVAAVVVLQRATRRFVAVQKLRRMTKNRIKRMRVIQEIVATERDYLRHLRVCQEVFVGGVAGLVQNDRISHADFAAIFATGYLQIPELHARMLALLEPCVFPHGDNTFDHFAMVVRDCFLPCLSSFRLYAPYCSGYKNAIDTWSRLKRDPDLHVVLQAMEQDNRTIRLGLISYLIMPISRVPRYRLLLRDLYKVTEPEHPDYPYLQPALVMMSQVADFLYNDIRKMENRDEVAAEAGRFLPDPTVQRLLNADLRLFICKDELQMSSHLEFDFESKTVYVLLMTDIIIISEYAAGDRYRYLGHFELKDVSLLVNEAGFPLTFLLVCGETEIAFRCGGCSDYDRWLRCLHERIEECRISSRRCAEEEE